MRVDLRPLHRLEILLGPAHLLVRVEGRRSLVALRRHWNLIVLEICCWVLVRVYVLWGAKLLLINGTHGTVIVFKVELGDFIRLFDGIWIIVPRLEGLNRLWLCWYNILHLILKKGCVLLEQWNLLMHEEFAAEIRLLAATRHFLIGWH